MRHIPHITRCIPHITQTPHVTYTCYIILLVPSLFLLTWQIFLTWRIHLTSSYSSHRSYPLHHQYFSIHSYSLLCMIINVSCVFLTSLILLTSHILLTWHLLITSHILLTSLILPPMHVNKRIQLQTVLATFVAVAAPAGAAPSSNAWKQIFVPPVVACSLPLCDEVYVWKCVVEYLKRDTSLHQCHRFAIMLSFSVSLLFFLSLYIIRRYVESL